MEHEQLVFDRVSKQWGRLLRDSQSDKVFFVEFEGSAPETLLPSRHTRVTVGFPNYWLFKDLGQNLKDFEADPSHFILRSLQCQPGRAEKTKANLLNLVLGYLVPEPRSKSKQVTSLLNQLTNTFNRAWDEFLNLPEVEANNREKGIAYCASPISYKATPFAGSTDQNEHNATENKALDSLGELATKLYFDSEDKSKIKRSQKEHSGKYILLEIYFDLLLKGTLQVSTLESFDNHFFQVALEARSLKESNVEVFDDIWARLVASKQLLSVAVFVSAQSKIVATKKRQLLASGEYSSLNEWIQSCIDGVKTDSSPGRHAQGQALLNDFLPLINNGTIENSTLARGLALLATPRNKAFEESIRFLTEEFCELLVQNSNFFDVDALHQMPALVAELPWTKNRFLAQVKLAHLKIQMNSPVYWRFLTLENISDFFDDVRQALQSEELPDELKKVLAKEIIENCGASIPALGMVLTLGQQTIEVLVEKVKNDVTCKDAWADLFETDKDLQEFRDCLFGTAEIPELRKQLEIVLESKSRIEVDIIRARDEADAAKQHLEDLMRRTASEAKVSHNFVEQEVQKRTLSVVLALADLLAYFNKANGTVPGKEIEQYLTQRALLVGLNQIGKTGDKVPFNPDLHLLEGGNPPDGSKVEVVQPGYIFVTTDTNFVVKKSTVKSII